MVMSRISGTDNDTIMGSVLPYAGTFAKMRTPFSIIQCQCHGNVGVVADTVPKGMWKLGTVDR